MKAVHLIGPKRVELREVPEPSATRRKLAARFEPRAIIDPTSESLAARVREMTTGVGADIVISANSVAQTQTVAVEIVRKRGKVILFGGLPKADPMVTLDGNRIHYGEIEVLGAFSYHATMHELALDLIHRKVIRADLVVTRTFGLDDIDRAFAAAVAGEALRVVVTTDPPRLRQAPLYRDMGNGPYYMFFRPYHLCSIEVPLTCAILVIRGKSNMAPLDRLVSGVFAVAKRTLEPGDVLDGIGGSTFYSLIDTYEVARAERLLPVGLANDARVTKAVEKDQPITYEHVQLHEPSTVLELRRLQDAWMGGRLKEDVLTLSVDAMATD